MNIGIDLRALQTGHKYRGIGEVAKQVTQRIIDEVAGSRSAPKLLFYEYDDDDPKELLNIPDSVSYDVIKLGPMPENDTRPGKRHKLEYHVKSLFGEPISGSEKSDVFLQYDYAFGVPRNTKTVLIKHDLIPYVFWSKYFESAWVPFKNRAARSTLRTIFHNQRFMRVLRRSLKDADAIIAVSDSTKKDIETHFNVPTAKTKTVHLGVDIKPAKTDAVTTDISRLPSKPYLLFVGAGDERRRVDELVAAFNNLKARGHDIQLVLVGENFKAAEMIPLLSVRNAVLNSSYAKDILTLGYIDDATKQQLFKNALSFVYPTKYEGFGIPVLEAMLLRCPVITYKNSSIPEVSGEHARYASNWQDIVKQVELLQSESESVVKDKLDKAYHHAETFTWDKTASLVYDELIRVSGASEK